MKLKTIWSMPPKAMSLREKLKRTRERGWQLAAISLPKKLAYWSFIYQGAKHMEPTEEVPTVPYTEILSRIILEQTPAPRVKR